MIFKAEPIKYLWRIQRASALNRAIFCICENDRFLQAIIFYTYVMGPVLNFEDSSASQTNENPHEYERF